MVSGTSVADRPVPPSAAVTDGGKPVGLRQRKKTRTRAQFLDAANRLFDERGYDAVTVEDIASAIDVSPRTFFRYFRGKEELVLDDVGDQLATLVDSLASRPPTESAADALAAALGELAAAIDRRREAFLRSHALISRSPQLVVANLATLRQWESGVQAHVRGRLSGPDVPLRARLLVGTYLVALRVAVDAWAHDPTCTLEERLGRTLELLRGLDDADLAHRSTGQVSR